MANTIENVEAASTSGTNEVEFHEAFERMREEIEAVPEQDLEPINLNVPSTVTTVLGAELEIRDQRSDLVALPGFDMRNVDRLRDHAKALGYAHTRYRGATEGPDGLTELVEQMVDRRDLFHTDAAALVRRGLLSEKRVDAYRGGNSHKMIAFDVIGLVDLLLGEWDTIGSRTALQREELEQARSQANRLVAALGEREQAPAVKNEAAVVRQKAYTLLVRSYNETRQAIAFGAGKATWTTLRPHSTWGEASVHPSRSPWCRNPRRYAPSRRRAKTPTRRTYRPVSRAPIRSFETTIDANLETKAHAEKPPVGAYCPLSGGQQARRPGLPPHHLTTYRPTLPIHPPSTRSSR